jgi:hypothetical protein
MYRFRRASACKWTLESDPPHSPHRSPHNAKDLGNNRVQLTVKPDEEAVRLTSTAYYTGGKFEFKVRPCRNPCCVWVSQSVPPTHEAPAGTNMPCPTRCLLMHAGQVRFGDARHHHRRLLRLG